MVGWLFLSAKPLNSDVRAALNAVATRTARGDSIIELVHDGTNNPLALATYLIAATNQTFFHTPTSPVENFAL